MTALQRGDVVVCVIGSGAGDEDLRARTPPAVPILEATSRPDAFAQAAPADVVLLQPGCRVATGWLDSLRDAAYASSNTATATALTQHDLETDLVAHFDRAAVDVHDASLRVHPRIEAPHDSCVYVRRDAIELVGNDDADFWGQCVARGLAHVLADDVLIVEPRGLRPSMHEPAPPEARATAAARRALRGFSAMIDARILSGPTTGTQVHVLELIASLARTERLRLTAILPEAPSEHALMRLQALSSVNLTTYRHAPRAGKTDVVHRPFQLSNAGDLGFLASLGERLLLTQQDLIAYHNPAYFPSRDAWWEYRQLTRTALGTADRVLFFSAHARDDALAEELVDPAHASVVHLGVDHPQATEKQEAPPAGADPIAARPFLLCLGTDFLHKNRLFALRMFEALVEQGTDATLVFAGPAVIHGSSRPLETLHLAARPGLAGRVTDLGAVTEAEKQWLYNRAALVVYPSVLEGFGLVPFEAAAHRVPCLWAPGSSLSELLPDEAAGIVPWDPDRSAQNARALMHDDSARRRNLEAIDTAARRLAWDTTAERLLEVYRATADAPAGPRAGAGFTLSEDAARLVGPGGELPADVHRPLLAVATHPRIARPFYSALRLGYRASHRLLQRRR